MEMLEIDENQNVKFSLSRSTAQTLNNLALNAWEFANELNFYSKSNFSEDEIEFFRDKIGGSYRFFPDDGKSFDEISCDAKIDLWFAKRDILLLIEITHFCNNRIDDWEYHTLIDEYKEVTWKLYNFLRNIIDKE